ncbi:MAG: shikimate dehydrogenase family protein [Acidimicrobiales bacterium]
MASFEVTRESRESPLWPTAHSRVVGVIGDPITHSLSPLLYNAAFDALGMDWVPVAFTVGEDECEAALAGLRALKIAGLSVTMPLKTRAASLMDRLTPTAEVLGAVNCVTLSGGSFVGDSTDGSGFIDSLHHLADVDLQAMRCVVVGAGGAARAVVHALGMDGAGDIAIVGRSPVKVNAAVAVAGRAGRAGNSEDISRADLIVQATPVGMASRDEAGGDTGRDEVGEDRARGDQTGRDEAGGNVGMPFDPNLLREGQLLVDLIYHPAVTPIISAASLRGVRAVNGLGMLVHQAAFQIARWCEVDPPVEAMWAAVRTHSRVG